ncbi:MAG: PEP-CTERM sorting domain-containing protein [Chthoniobacterales bacterium]
MKLKLPTKSLIYKLILPSILAFASSAHSQIVTLLDDTFASGTNPGYTESAVGGATISVTTAPSGMTDNALLLSTASNNRGMLRSLNSSVTLAEAGDYIDLTYNFKFDTTPPNLANSFRSQFMGSSGAAFAGIGFDFSGLASNSSVYITDGTGNLGKIAGINAGTTVHSFGIRLTMLSDTTAQLTASYDGSALTSSSTITTATSLPNGLTFDQIGLMFVGNPAVGDIYFDNVLVTTNVIPEPGSAMLALFGAAFLGYRRLRRA